MKRLLAFLLFTLLPTTAAAQRSALEELAELPGVGGNEARVSQWLAARLARFEPAVDNLGNVVVTIGSGEPHRVFVTAMDEPGYVVSALTPDGYLRVERIPAAPPHPWFELLHSAQPVQILTRSGKLVPGIVAGLSTHLQPGRESPAEKRTDHIDRIYIDVGARSAEEVRELGVDLLGPLTLEKHAYWLGNSELTAPFAGERAGAAALVRLLEGMDVSRLDGTLSVAFLVRRYLGNQGLDRLLRSVGADEFVLLDRVEKSDATPGAGALVASFEGAGTALADEMLAIAGEENIPARSAPAQTAPRGRYTGAFDLPERAAVVGVPVRWPQTPAEVVSARDAEGVARLLAAYLGAALEPEPTTGVGAGGGAGGTSRQDVGDYLRDLVGIYGVSGYEQPVAERVIGMLPPAAREWAAVDAKGNVFLAFGRPSAKPSLVFVAHMDEIGWVAKEIGEDGRLVLDRRGGFLEEHFLGHAVYIHTGDGMVPAVLELPEDYRTKKYERVQGREHVAYLGARTRAEAEARGIRTGDSVTVPKQFRKLAGTRINGRSFDDRVGCAALIGATWELWRRLAPGDQGVEGVDREVIFVWSVEEEIGLEGAKHFAARAAETGGVPAFVFAVDTFVSGDSPLESSRFAQARLGEGFVVRAVDTSNVAPREWVDRVLAIARKNNIAVQYGVTGGGNDGAAFVPYGAVDVPLGWPLRYSHSAGEVADLKDVEALASIVAALVREF